MPDRKKVIEGLKKLHGTSETMTLIAETITLLEAQPEIVRCKDCKHATMTIDGDLCKYCDLETDDDGYPIELYLEANWFCAGAEERISKIP